MKEIYIIKWDQGSYDDYVVNNGTTAYVSIEAAQKAKQDLENSMIPKPFPLTWCTQEEFELLIENDDKSISNEDIETYYHWDVLNYNRNNFNKAWIETLKLDLEDLRDTKIKSILDE